MATFPAGFVEPVYKFRFFPRKNSIYSTFYVKGSRRAPYTPRVIQGWRTRRLMSLTAFFRNRFYEIDRWYKARIEKPIVYPTCYFIDPDDFTLSLAERLEDLKPEREFDLINIGLPYEPPSAKENLEKSKFFDTNLEEKEQIERLARLKKLLLPIKEIEKSSQYLHQNIQTRKFFAEHYNIFKNLFHDDAFFYPVVDMQISYPVSDASESANPVFYGNYLMPQQTLKPPEINYHAEPGTFWTILMTNPDGNVFEEKKEILHWLMCNIPENKIDKGELLCDYLQPLPLRNTGWHRMIFILFKQEGKIDLSKLKLPIPCNDFKSRSFSTPEFYLKYENSLTPAGLAFFQTKWDDSCTKCFHERLNLEQPFYNFEWPEPYFEPQEEFPSHKKEFNTYLDRYRDYKDIDKEIFLKRLKRVSPFAPDKEKSKFPNLFFQEDSENMPSWLHVQKVKENEGYGKYAGIYRNPID